MTVSYLDHVILPKEITDDFYATLSTCYEDIFPPTSKPKDALSPKIKTSFFGAVSLATGPSTGTLLKDAGDPDSNSMTSTSVKPKRVGENIDEFIRTSRQNILKKSNSSGDLLEAAQLLRQQDYFLQTCSQKNKYFSLKNPHHHLCPTGTTGLFSSLPRSRKKKTYKIIDKEEEYDSN